MREARDGLEQPQVTDGEDVTERHDHLTAEAAETPLHYRRALEQVEDLRRSLGGDPVQSGAVEEPANEPKTPPGVSQGPSESEASDKVAELVEAPEPAELVGPAEITLDPAEIRLDSAQGGRPAEIRQGEESPEISEPAPRRPDPPLTVAAPAEESSKRHAETSAVYQPSVSASLPEPAVVPARRHMRLVVPGAIVVLVALAVFFFRPGGPAQQSRDNGSSGLSGSDTVLRETDSSEDAGSAEPSKVKERKRSVSTRHHVNRSGDYSFTYPKQWTLRSSGELSKVWGPKGDVVTSFALGPRRLSSTYKSFVELLARSYDDVLISDVRDAAVSGNDALAVRGRGRDRTGRRITFRALLVERKHERSVGAFAVTLGAPFDTRLDDILRSLSV